ncbi:MAG: hypothetical protein M1131_03760 [Actinobacteria bacterium]|jgi:phosphate transport system protein|nr:hypothetical protein [Actinomycetota bacterium]MCL6094309.1 hypothetical protein [Actinomycetota bacterium]
MAEEVPEEADNPYAELDRQVIQLFALVGEALAGATVSLLTSDRESAKELANRDIEIDQRYRAIERLVIDRLSAGNYEPSELSFFVGLLSMLPEIERSGDLAEHIARRAIRSLGVEMSPRCRGLVERMGEVATRMWKIATDAYADRSTSAYSIVESLDDEMDDLHVTLTAELVGGSLSLPLAIEMALIARFYERFGDHAVNLARRAATLQTASPNGS